ncbi:MULTISPECIES: hypothetical protein [unclassified Corallococcus]|uniref:hypothetical protein n=1 Tax=unclassified Corallococcus TaxID=2685029 RepID=UPI001A8F62D5|nr:MULTISPECIES: hypothetical protein [unclassified Corallococcus]MBN9682609.1 hypothetical protein [Corallococcus sp. NCSPR001]WAS85845.1 hypothetical protein O0N60_02460 [Corallococcus sp. NCRR]
MRPGVIRAWLCAGLAATLLMAPACQEQSRGTADSEHGGGEKGQVEAPALSASTKPSPGASVAERLKAEAPLVESARLVSCQGDKVLARMPEPLLTQLRTALPQAAVSRTPALTTPPWESVLLELNFRDGRAVFAQLVREDVLRLREERWCGAGVQGVELLLSDGPSLLPWFQQHLGPVQSKEQQLPPGLPPPP